MLRKLIVATLGLVALAVLALGLVVREDVVHLRSVVPIAAPVPPLVRSAILATGIPVLARRALYIPRPGVLRCGPPTVADVVVQKRLAPGRPLWRHARWFTTAYVVGLLFTPEDLLRVYAHDVYVGTIDRHAIIGIERASSVYFHKSAAALTPEEAATLAAMLRAPNYYSLARHPDLLAKRRDWVLARMESSAK